MLAAILKCLRNFRLVEADRVIAKITLAFGMGCRKRTRPRLPRNVILIDQQLQSGPEFDQFGVKALRGRRCCGGGDRKGGGKKGSAGNYNGPTG
jgi:hypothetical protein